MASLTEVMYRTRIVLKATLFSVIFLVIAWNIYKYVYNQYRRRYPLPPPPPNVFYGRLTELSWPPNKTDLTDGIDLKYNISKTKERQLKNKVGYVLAYLKNRANIWGPNELVETAKVMGFDNKEGRLPDRPTWVRFYKNNNTTLDIDEETGYFDVTTKGINKLNLAIGSFFQVDEATNFVKSWLSKALFWSDDLVLDRVDYFSILNGKKIKVDAISDAKIIKLSYRRQLIFNRPSLFNEAEPIVEIEVAKPEGKINVLTARFRYRPVFLNKPATYPLVFPNQSWQYLKQGKGFIIRAPAGSVVVDKVELVFYDPMAPYRYMVPAYLFSSSKSDFMALSSALP